MGGPSSFLNPNLFSLPPYAVLSLPYFVVVVGTEDVLISYFGLVSYFDLASSLVEGYLLAGSSFSDVELLSLLNFAYLFAKTFMSESCLLFCRPDVLSDGVVSSLDFTPY